MGKYGKQGYGLTPVVQIVVTLFIPPCIVGPGDQRDLDESSLE